MQEPPYDRPSSEGRTTQRLEPLETTVLGPPPVPLRTTVLNQPVQSLPHNNRNRLLAYLLIGLGLAMLASNMGGSSLMGSGGSRTYPVEIEREAAAAAVRFDWGSGRLNVSGTQGTALVTGSVVGRDGPSIDIGEDDDDRLGRVTEVSIQDHGSGWFNGSASGDLALNEDPEYNLEFDLGSGSFDLDLSNLTVAELEVDAGSGRVGLLLPARGTTTGSLDLGSGVMEITLPPTMEARVVIDQGSGAFDGGNRLEEVTRGRGDERVFETSGYTTGARDSIDLEIDGGSGYISIR